MPRYELHISDIAVPDTMGIECSLLNSAMFAGHKMAQLRRMIRPEFFHDERNRLAWETIADLSSRGELIDNQALYVHFATDKAMQEHIIGKIMDAPYTCSDRELDKMAEALRDGYVRRQAYDRSAAILDAINKGKPVGSLLTDLGNLKEDIAQVLRSNELQTAAEAGAELAQDIAASKISRIKTHIDTLDYSLYGGLPSGSLVILAARPSVGKTTIGLQMAQKAALDGKRACFFSLEMTAKELAQRLIVATGKVTPSDIVSSRVDWQAYNAAVVEALPDTLALMDKEKTLAAIDGKIRSLVQGGECNIAFIDYLGLVVQESKYKTLAQVIGEVTKALKICAMECNIPIVLLCQLNRDSAKEKRSPDISDLRDSGNIEQDADIVLMLERPRDGNDQDLDNRIDMWLRKNRNGRRLKDAIMLQGNEYYSNFVETKTTAIYKNNNNLPF